jgi:hypothetical protein
MESYQLTTVVVATVMLILILTYLGLQLSKSQNQAIFPPAYSTCPDYWTTNTDGTCTAGSKNLGSFSSGYSVDPKTLISPGLTLPCSIQKWANTNSIVWDGYNNYNKCTTSS